MTFYSLLKEEKRPWEWLSRKIDFFFFLKALILVPSKPKPKPCDTAGALPIFSTVVAKLWF